MPSYFLGRVLGRVESTLQPIIKLNSSFITNNLKCPDEKRRIEYCDKSVPGLYIEVRATSPGEGTYYLRYKDPTGKTCHQKIGRTTEIKLEDARKKAKKVRSVPLNDAAVEVLDNLDTEEEFAYLFINKGTSKPYTTIHKVWDRLRNEAGLSHLRIHDLRHQFASLLVNSGRTLYEVQHILGHSDPQVTQRYAHLSTKALQEAADSASVAISRASGGSA